MTEFSRMIDLREIGDRPVRIEASAEECAVLASRFFLVAVERLAAVVTLEPDGGVIDASGQLSAAIIQSCAVSGEDLAVTIEEPLRFRFVPADSGPQGEDIELTTDQLDEIEYSGTAFDLGEAVAQSLALAIDPYAEGPNADEARRAAGLVDGNRDNAFSRLLKR